MEKTNSFKERKAGSIMFGFDKMFDFNHDGRLDFAERAAQFMFLDEMSKEDKDDYSFDDDDNDEDDDW